MTGFYGREAAMDIVALFCDLDNFAVHFEAHCKRPQLSGGIRHRHRPSRLHLSEVMTIMVLFHGSNYRTFKHFYLHYVRVHMRSEFPRLVSYGRFVELIPNALIALIGFLHTRKRPCTGISFIDSTPLRVCHNLRIGQHRVLAGLAQRGKTSTGWFFGFKLHLAVNQHGELLEVCITPGNVDDRTPVDALTRELWGKLFGDKGYLSQPLFARLFERGIQLITRLKGNMKNRLISLADKRLLNKRPLIETIIDQLKNLCQIEHSRHRGVPNYFADIIAGLVAYTYRDKLPSLKFPPEEKHRRLVAA